MINRFQISDFRFQKRGFTLIELLVVISIIAILSTIGLTSFSTIQRKGRDARRKADLREMKNALEQYYTICGFVYPLPVEGDNFYDKIICNSPVYQEILNTFLTDPRSGDYYRCPEVIADNCNENQFKICTELESESPSTYCVYSSQ